MLLLLSILLMYMAFRTLERPIVDFSSFLAELDKGNVKEFSYKLDAAVVKLRSIPVELLPADGTAKKAATGDAAANNNAAPPVASPTAEKSTTNSANDANPEQQANPTTAANSDKNSEPAATVQSVANRTTVPEKWRFVALRENLDFEVRLPPGVNTQSPTLTQQLVAAGVQVSRSTEVDPVYYYFILSLLIPAGMVLLIWLSIRRSQNQLFGGGGFLSSFTKSPAKRYESSKQPVTFKDVAGLEGVKADLQEIVEFLKDPTRFQKLGGRVPKGVLLNGPPGTGKTLLARAVAGEAGVPFFSVNGSEFIQMFVGVGASRVRDLFRNAKDNSPAIIFIDEIDAVGRQRGAGLGGGHDEREQTLNQILGEMDGFSQTDFVIVVAATNRPDVLDPALLRPGRFDRLVTVDRPTQKGRLELFRVHTRNVPLAANVDLERLASVTIGLTGADIRNIVNEAALWAARAAKSAVEMDDFEYARDKVLMGAKREEVLGEQEKERTAYHEAGHAILGWHMSGAHRVHKVTVVPRGRALGVTQFVPTEDRMNATEQELTDRLVVLLGGRAAEKVVYDQTTVGAENDLERATGLTRRMVTAWGMSSRLGPVSYKLGEEDPFLGREMHRMREFSEHTLELIDEEVARILHAAADRAMEFLREHRSELDALARELISNEELDEKDIEKILGPSVQTRNGHATPAEPATPPTATA
jgi:cell division protease FtsH